MPKNLVPSLIEQKGPLPHGHFPFEKKSELRGGCPTCQGRDLFFSLMLKDLAELFLQLPQDAYQHPPFYVF